MGPGHPPGTAWERSKCRAASGGGEWLVTARTAEANIRVDLLVIWPMLAVLAGWALNRTFR